ARATSATHRCRCFIPTRFWSGGRWRSPAVAQWCCGASSLRRAFCPTSATTARPMRTTWESRCRMCSPHPSARTTPTIHCGRCTATRAHPPTSTVSLPGSAAGSSTGSGRQRAGSPSAAARPSPVGVVGELVTATVAGRFEVYYNDPEANAQRMAGGIYHSGDLAYRDDAGYAYFSGRLGDWLRVDGENLGTAPIERVLARHPDVTEVAVYAVPDPAVGDQVMAALVLTSGAEFDTDKFRAFLAEQTDLGPKQWPSYVRVSTSLPRTATYKVLKRQLSAEGLDCADPVWPIRR